MEKKPYKKWSGRAISDADHAACVRAIGPRYDALVAPITTEMGLAPRGRYHRSPDAPCVYVFRTDELAADHRGLVFHVQLSPDESLAEIVFREWEGTPPFGQQQWDALQPNTWEPSKRQWRGFRVFREFDLEQAKDLVTKCVSRFDEVYGDAI